MPRVVERFHGWAMSDKMRSAKSEDLILSIRRLVSDVPQAARPELVKTQADRLVLGPDLRVNPRRVAPVVPSETASPGIRVQEPLNLGTPLARGAVSDERATVHTVAEQPALRMSEPNLAQRLAEIETFLNAQQEEFEPDPDPGLSRRERRRAAQIAARKAAAEAPFVLAPEAKVTVSAEVVAFSGADARDDSGARGHISAGDDVARTEVAPEVQAVKEEFHLAAAEEAYLTGLIRKILREELQGGTAERLPRDMRRLVQAEVARILMEKGIA